MNSTTLLKRHKETITHIADVLFYTNRKDWRGLERYLDIIDVEQAETSVLYYVLMLSAPHRHFINNWYSMRYQTLDQFMIRCVSPYFFQQLTQIR